MFHKIYQRKGKKNKLHLIINICLYITIIIFYINTYNNIVNASSNSTNTTSAAEDEKKKKEQPKFTEILQCAIRQKVCTTGEEQVALFFYVVAGTMLICFCCLFGYCCLRLRAKRNKGKIKPMVKINKRGRKTLKTMSTIKLRGNKAVPNAMSSIFGSYDKDRSGAIDRDELADMMIELAGLMPGQVAPSRVGARLIADQVLEVLDADGNGVLDKDEFSDWVIGKIHADEDERRQLALSNRHLYRFFEAMEVTLKMQLAGIGPFEENPYADSKAGATRDGSKTY